MTTTWSLATVMGDNKIANAKTCRKIASNFITMGMRRCKTGHNPQWSTSRASLKATDCLHWASVCGVLPRRPTWLAILVENTKY